MVSIWEKENAHDCTNECLKLYDQQKNVVRRGRQAAGLFVSCPVGMVEIWSGLQLSRGVWPHRLAPGIVAAAQSHAGDRERRLNMNVGVGLDVCVDVDVNEPLHDWEREKDRKRKERGRSKFRKGGERTTRFTGKNRDKNTQRVNEGTAHRRRANNKQQQQPANLVVWLLYSTQ